MYTFKPIALSSLMVAALASQAVAEDIEIETIVVTARKVEEQAKDVPISITAISQADIQARGAQRLSDLQYAVPNMVFSATETSIQPEVSIRGISIPQRNFGIEAGYGVYVDGVLAGRAASVNQDLPDVARVEVLRGPQGTLFGKNTIAGAINIVTREPDEQLRAEVAVSGGDFGKRRAEAYLSGPLSEDTLFGKISAFHNERDGYFDNLTTGRAQGNDDTTGVRGALRFTPTDRLDVTLSADYTDQKARDYQNELVSLSAAPGAQGTFNLFNTMFPALAPGKRTVMEGFDRGTERELGGAALTANYEFSNGFKLTSVTGYRTSDSIFGRDFDGAAADLLFFDIHVEDEQLTQEVRIASPRLGAFDFVAGLYYFDQSIDSDQALRSGTDWGQVAPLIGFPNFAYGTATTRQFGTIDTRAYAAFINANWHVSERVTINAGARYTEEDKDFFFNQTSVNPSYPNILDLRDNFSPSDVSPTASVLFRATDAVNLYATVGRGFKSGGWNADFVTSTDLDFGDETATNYEAGLKSVFFGGRLNAELAVFRLDYRDLQVNQSVPLGGGIFANVTTNAGEATSEGAELSLSGIPAKGLWLGLNVGYTDAKYDDYTVGSTDYSGNTLPYAPEWTVSTSLDYSRTLGTGGTEGFFRFDYGYRSKSFTAANNNPNSMTTVIRQLDARLGVRRGAWELALYGQNLLNEDNVRLAYQGSYSLIGLVPAAIAETRTYGVPRNWSLRLSYRY